MSYYSDISKEIGTANDYDWRLKVLGVLIAVVVGLLMAKYWRKK